MKSRLITFVLFLIIAVNMQSQNPNFHIYLCFGQSNMEGSADIEEQDKLPVEGFKVMASTDCDKNGREIGNWYDAVPPLSQCWARLSPSDYFGRTMAACTPDGIEVGVISVAVGGSDIRLFDKAIYQDYTNSYPAQWFVDQVNAYGGNPYERLISLAKQAQKNGVIKGILLHQGETNERDQNWPKYVKVVYDNMLRDLSLNAEDVPLLAGEVVHADMGGQCSSMNTIINTLPYTIPTAHVISSSKCSVSEDNVHFDSAGVRKLGRRYATEMLSILGY
ncbi:sialate O-acetylesterase [Saccharicrinis aurantiacus]|uniref:sialate O-acetylesterase n=1 Tax=Saccharicrinis aurantiacus TaxID=1849719 RepID=UPI00249334D7|nr:sialate O-acetylesterase [Saccharicrinis aurantiacus]